MDVYSDWVDACDAVAKDTANHYDGPIGSQAGASKQDVATDVRRADAYEEEDY